MPLLLARRPADAENQRLGQGQATPFLTRIGLRVLSASFFVSDNPSVRQLGGRPVAGAYVVDDEGVLGKEVSLVEKGRLMTLLTSRTPQRRLLTSSGHGRSGTVHAGVLQMSSTEAIPLSELKTQYLELLKLQDKSFGYIVRSIAPPGEAPGGQGGGPVILDVVKVTQDGREEPVRGLRFGDVPPSAFRDILEASQERALANYRINVVTAASVIVPSMIFEELEVEHTQGDRAESAARAVPAGAVVERRLYGHEGHEEQSRPATRRAAREDPTCPSRTRRRRARRSVLRRSPRR